jgi:hypothetical protein
MVQLHLAMNTCPFDTGLGLCAEVAGAPHRPPMYSKVSKTVASLQAA